MRFRKSISIAKGIKMNLSKSGVSFTVGGRGLSANVGSKGVYMNTSIPGTGLYDRKKIMDFNKPAPRTASGTRTASGARMASGTRTASGTRAPAAMPASITLAVGPDGGTLVYDQNGTLITDPAVLGKLRATASYRKAQEELTQRSIAEANATTEAFVNIGRLSADVPKAADYEAALREAPPETYVPEAFPDPQPTREGIRAWLEAEARKNVQSLAVWNLEKKREDYVRTRLASAYLEELEAWKQRKADFEAEQQRLAEAQNEGAREDYERRMAAIREGLDGGEDAVEAQIGAWLQGLELPIDFDVDFEYDAASGALLADMDLPEIQQLPQETMVELSTGKLKSRDKTQKELRQEYARCVFGLAMFCASHFFSVTPKMRRILLSGYTQRRNARTGEVQDEFIYSVIFTREAFEQPGYQAQEPEHFLNRFRNRMNLSPAGELKRIVPYEPADLMEESAR